MEYNSKTGGLCAQTVLFYAQYLCAVMYSVLWEQDALPGSIFGQFLPGRAFS